MFELCKRTQVAAFQAFDQASQDIENLLKNDELMLSHGARYRLTHRIKDKYQLFCKMHRKQLSSPSEVRDSLGLRVILDVPKRFNETDEQQHKRSNMLIYHIVSNIQALSGWTPLVNGLKDYVAEKKDNGYQSIHQYIKNIRLQSHVEVQVRTKEMHLTAELGNAAHWYYKDKIYRPAVVESRAYKTAWRSQYQMNAQSPAELIGMAQSQIKASRVLVFLEDKSTVLNLRKGSTALDAAFAIHSELGLSAVSVKVKGRRTGLSRPLENGDVITVERCRSGNINAKHEWINFVKSPNSLAAVRKYLRDKERDSTACVGFIQLLSGLALNRDKIMARHGELPSAYKICVLASRKPGHHIGNLLLHLGTSTISEAQVCLARLFDIPASDFELESLPKSLGWARLKSKVNWKDDRYLLEDILIPILYSALPTLGFNTVRNSWLRMRFGNPFGVRKVLEKPMKSETNSRRKIRPEFYSKFADEENALEQSWRMEENQSKYIFEPDSSVEAFNSSPYNLWASSLDNLVLKELKIAHIEKALRRERSEKNMYI